MSQTRGYVSNLSSSLSLIFLTNWDRFEFEASVATGVWQTALFKYKITRPCGVYEALSFHLWGLCVFPTITMLVCCCTSHQASGCRVCLLWREGIACFARSHVFVVCDVLSYMILDHNLLRQCMLYPWRCFTTRVRYSVSACSGLCVLIWTYKHKGNICRTPLGAPLHRTTTRQL